MKNVIFEKVRALTIIDWMNETKTKKSKSKSNFNQVDFYFYVKRGALPEYLGNYKIEVVTEPLAYRNLYNLIEIKNENEL